MKFALITAIIVMLLISVGVILVWPEAQTGSVSKQTAAQAEEEEKKVEQKQEIPKLEPLAKGAKVQTIGPSEAKILMSGNNVLIIDVRTSEEYVTGHIEKAINVPLEQVSTVVPKEYPDKWKMVLVYCKSGNRSAKAAKMLADKLYVNVFDFGGINDWPYEVVQ